MSILDDIDLTMLYERIGTLESRIHELERKVYDLPEEVVLAPSSPLPTANVGITPKDKQTTTIIPE